MDVDHQKTVTASSVEDVQDDMPIVKPARGNIQQIRKHAEGLSNALQKQRLRMYPPAAQRTFRKLTSGEAAKLLGVNDAYLRQLSLDGKGPQPEQQPNGRRLYTLEDLRDLRHLLAKTAKGKRRYVKHRGPGEHLQVLTCINFKGGSAKTTTAAHLAQHLALHGYRVLAVDMDPQASLSVLHGIQPECDVLDNQTMYASIRYDELKRPLKDAIRQTHIVGLDIVPAHLELMEFEHATPTALLKRAPREEFFYSRVHSALQSVEENYDVVVIDCPPQLGYLAISALSASTGVLVTVHPQMLDIMSMSQFLAMTHELMSVVAERGATVDFDFFKYVPTRFEPRDTPQAGVLEFIRSQFGDHVCDNTMLKSTAISDAGLKKQTLYEASRDDFSRSTYDRAHESLNLMNGEIEGLIKHSWGRTY